MTNYAHSNVKFYAYTVFTLAGLSFVTAGFLVPSALSYAKSESIRYTNEAKQGQGSEAALDYRMAVLLDSHNEAAAVGLARVYLAGGRSDEALKLLDGVGENEEGLRLRTLTLTELNRYSDAKISADKLVAHGNEADMLLAAATYKLGGYKTELAALDTRLTSVEALQGLSRLKAGEITEALELRSLGLPQSSSAILVKLPPSTPRSLALGESLLQKGDKDSLAQATDYLSNGIKLDPANIELRQMYSKVLRAQKKVDEADAQDALVLRLRQGKL